MPPWDFVNAVTTDLLKCQDCQDYFHWQPSSSAGRLNYYYHQHHHVSGYTTPFICRGNARLFSFK